MKLQSKIGSCKEVFRTRAATITRQKLECFGLLKRGTGALFVIPPGESHPAGEAAPPQGRGAGSMAAQNGEHTRRNDYERGGACR